MALFISVAILLLAACDAAGGGTSSAFEFRPGVVVAERTTVYLMNPERGIDAVDLATGKRLWRTDRAALPLLLHKDQLVAQTEPRSGQHVLRIAVLDTRDAPVDPRFFDIPLPADVRPSVDDGMESSFRTTARVHQGAVLLSWRYTYRRASGAPPGPDDRVSDREAAGSVLLDFDTGRVDSLNEEPPLPEVQLPAAVTRLMDTDAQSGPVRRAGAVFVVIQRATHEDGQRVALQRWDAETGEALADITLFEGGLMFRSVSADGRHLLASRRNLSDSAIWEWVVYSLETGTQVAELQADTPSARFFLANTLLVHETNVTRQPVGGRAVNKPGTLRAINFETGAQLWSHAIRDIAYRGPYPP